MSIAMCGTRSRPDARPETGGLIKKVNLTWFQSSNVSPPGSLLTDMENIQYQVKTAKLQGGYVPQNLFLVM